MTGSEKREHWIGLLVQALVFIYPTSVLFMKHSFTPAMLLMMLYGSVVFFKERKAGKSASQTDEMIFFWVGSFGIAVSVVSLLIGGDLLRIGTMELEFIDKQLRFLFFIPFLVIMKKLGMPERIIWWGAVFAALASGLYAVAIKLFHHDIIRVAGGGNPINYGCFSIISAYISMAGLMYFRNIKRFYSLIPFAAFLMGLTGGVLSGSRGAWAAIPVLTLITLWSFRKNFRIHHILGFFSAAVLFVVMISMSVDRSIISDRMEEAGSAVIKYFSGEEALDTSTDSGLVSIGGRLEMYRTSLDIIKNNPVLGVGPGRYHRTVMEYIGQGKADRAIEIYQYPHNDYLTVATCGGMLGLAAFILTAYLAPMLIIYRCGGKSTENPLFWAGILIIAGFMVFSLTNSAMFKNVRLHYYFLLVSAIAAALFHSGQKDKKMVRPS